MLRRYPLAGGQADTVQQASWDITSTTFSHNGRYRASVVNQDGRPVVSIVDASSGTPVELPAVANGSVASTRFSRSESKIAMYINGDRSPNDLYVLDLGTKKMTKLTDSLNPEIDGADLVDAATVRFKARDGMTIPEFPLETASGDDDQQGAGARLGAWRSGGTDRAGLQRRDAVPRKPRVCGAGDQQSWQFRIWKDLLRGRRQETRTRAVVGLCRCQEVSSDARLRRSGRIGIIGGSYGGYMVLAALAFQPQEFIVGVDLFGVANWIRTLESIPSWWEAQRIALYAEMGDPVKDRQMLEQASPLLHANLIRKPLLVLQGANDPRVLKVESDEVVAAVKKNGVPVEYIVFPDEGHGFTKRANQIAGYSAILRFLDQQLKKPM